MASPNLFPASLAQACLYLHDTQCILDRADDAFRYASLARHVLENFDFHESDFDQEEADNLEINAIRGQGVALHNLGLDRQAQTYYLEARTTAAYNNLKDFWEPQVGRDLVNAMVPVPRFSIREAKEISNGIRAICESSGDELALLLARESWLRCLIQRDHMKQAEQVYQKELERLAHVNSIGPLHRALLMKSGAELAWKMNDKATWEERIRNTMKLMHDAGLHHQLRSVKERYGPHVKLIFEYLNICACRNYSK